jgi:hypothetical protein
MLRYQYSCGRPISCSSVDHAGLALFETAPAYPQPRRRCLAQPLG